jgi:hypothetical protein
MLHVGGTVAQWHEGSRVSDHKVAANVLTEWRQAERDRLLAVDESVEAAALDGEIVRLRDEYQRLVLAARVSGIPEQSPFPAKS